MLVALLPLVGHARLHHPGEETLSLPVHLLGRLATGADIACRRPTSMANRGTIVLSIDDVDLLLDLFPAPEREENERITDLRNKVSCRAKADARAERTRRTDGRLGTWKLQELRLQLLQGAVDA